MFAQSPNRYEIEPFSGTYLVNFSNTRESGIFVIEDFSEYAIPLAQLQVHAHRDLQVQQPFSERHLIWVRRHNRLKLYIHKVLTQGQNVLCSVVKYVR